ncbi:hypothetical protein GQ53DRAFT_810317 [Thozetella sp. PMI_491]|nr:hypothetical protein GQ53DRAFT_810317 [Thozetella sp. PMI_491]
MDSSSTAQKNPGSSPKDAGQPKRRACDECRTRKLACSKEADGCARCKREGIRCHYSPQKPMGRPRKRPHAETVDNPQQPVQQGQQLEQQRPQEPAHLPHPQPYDYPPVGFPEDGQTLGMDLDMSFLDVGGNDLNFLDLLGSGLPASSALSGAAIGEPTPKVLPYNTGGGGGLWPTDMANISFDSLAMPQPPQHVEQVENTTLDQLANFMAAPEVPDKLPSLSPPSSHSGSHQHTPPDMSDASPAVCGCGASLYLAMDSLQNLPKEVGPAMCVTRTAAKAAHNCILCKICGNPPISMATKPPITSFQNMMMLGGLLPTISNAYTRILAMVDAETSKAEAERRKITFTLADYGGLWGQLAREDVKCGASATLEGAVLEPSMWRLTVRALLKVDVYGINDKATRIGDSCDCTQPGLKDIIGMMEERSRTRHAHMDALVAAGELEPPSHGLYVPLSEHPTCLRIIDIAKKSMDDLIIP